LANLLTQKEKIRVKDLHIKEDGTKCVYCTEELDLETCVIAHLDNNPKNNNDWNHGLAHQKCNIDAIENNGFDLAKRSVELFGTATEYVLCLYYKDDSRKHVLAEKYKGKIKYRYWKSDEDTIKGKYSKEYRKTIRS